MFRVLLGLLTAAVLLTPGGAYAQRADRCVDDKGAAYVAHSASPASCASQHMPVVSDKPATTPQELEGTKRYLEAQLATEGDREWRCKVDHERINEIKDDALDAVDALSDNRRNGRVSRAETRAARRIEQSADSVQARAQQCVAQAQAHAAEIRATLSDPVKLAAQVPEWRAEQQRVKVEQERRLAALRASEEKRLADERTQQKAEKIEQERRLAALRASEEMRLAAERVQQERRLAALRAAEEKRLADERAAEAKRRAQEENLQRHRAHLHSQLVALVMQGQSLAKALRGGVLPPNFSAQVQGLKKNVDAVQASYAYFLGRGEEKELCSVASRMTAALVGADGVLKAERYFAAEVAALQAELNQAKFTTASRLRYFQQMQAEHQESQRQLAIHQDTLSKAIDDPAVIALQSAAGPPSTPKE